MAGEAPLLFQTDKGPTLVWGAVHFYPSPDPEEYARRKARVFSCAPRTLVFVPSIGLGYGLRELLAALPEDTAVLCVEAFQEVMAIAAARDIPRDPRLLIVRTADPAVAAEAVRQLGTGRFRRVVELPLCAGYRRAPELYRGLRQAMEEEISRHWHNRLTLIALGSLQVRNVISNLPLLRGALDFSALSTDLPVVVAGAGPSLDKCMEDLLRNRPRFMLLAVDTALPSLRSAGLEPDIVIALEAQLANLQDFVPGVHPRTLLACDISSHPAAARLFSGRIFFFCSTFAPLRLFDRMARDGLLPTVFPPLGSVGVTAVHAALRLTPRQVFLAGLDFSFPGLRMHARNAPSQLGMLTASTRLCPIGQEGFAAMAARSLVTVAGKNGATVRTDRVLRSYRDSLERDVVVERGRVADISSEGLPLGVRAISPGEMEQMLDRVDAKGQRVSIDTGKGYPSTAVAGFLRAEEALLRRAVEMQTPTPAAGTAERDTTEEMIEEIGHVWLHFPDRPDGAASPGFVARARVAAAYYLQRITRVESVL